MQNKIDEFVKLLSQMEAIEVLGLARLLNIPITILDTAQVTYTDTKVEPAQSHRQPRAGQDILEDIIAAFGLMNRVRKRNLLTIMRQSVKSTKRARKAKATAEETSNGAPAKN